MGLTEDVTPETTTKATTIAEPRKSIMSRMRELLRLIRSTREHLLSYPIYRFSIFRVNQIWYEGPMH
jgi:hypothetical protein